MTLSSAKVGAGHRIIGCNAAGTVRAKLETMGLVPGEKVSVVSASAAGLIIEVKRSRLAISQDMAESLIIA
jgi:ferrous iron transport protein A